MIKLIKSLTGLIKSIANELIVIGVLLLTVQLCIGETNEIIKSDGVGYYEYLPSLFIHHDLYRQSTPISKQKTNFYRTDQMEVYVDYNGYHINKYSAGTAVLQLPFFYATLTSLNGNKTLNGYEAPFHKAIHLATLFYLFIGLFFLKKLLQLFDHSFLLILFIQLIIVLGTPIIHYSNNEAAFSHIYSFFAVSAFLFYVKKHSLYLRQSDLIYSALLLGLIFILRQVNILIILSIPLLFNTWKDFTRYLKSMLRQKKRLLVSVIFLLTPLSIQCILWHAQTGQYIVDSYQREGFNFLKPELLNILISYKKGLFIYTPVLILSIISFVLLIIKKKQLLAFSWFIFFSTTTYVLSSWYQWYFGCSYGQRAFIDYYPVFALMIALLFKFSNKKASIMYVLLALILIPINIIQTYQYKEYILHWINMDKEKYWDVFLKTDKKYSGLVWKEIPDLETVKTISETLKSKHTILPKQTDTLIIIPKLSKSINGILLSMETTVKENEKAICELIIETTSDSAKTVYYYSHPFIRYKTSAFNTYQKANYFYPNISLPKNHEYQLTYKFYDATNFTKIDNIKFTFIEQ